MIVAPLDTEIKKEEEERKNYIGMLAFAILDWLDARRTSPRRASAITITSLGQTIKKANKDRTYKRIHILVSILILDKGRMIKFCIPRQLE